MDEVVKTVLTKLEAQCARREYCTFDVRQKALKLLGCEDGRDSRADAVLKSLSENGFVDDLRYAGAFAREKASLTGWGTVKIRFALRSKHIDSGIIDEALEGIDAASLEEKLRKLVVSKAESLKGDPQIRLKLIRFALSRGYEYPIVEKVVGQAI